MIPSGTNYYPQTCALKIKVIFLFVDMTEQMTTIRIFVLFFSRTEELHPQTELLRGSSLDLMFILIL